MSGGVRDCLYNSTIIVVPVNLTKFGHFTSLTKLPQNRRICTHSSSKADYTPNNFLIFKLLQAVIFWVTCCLQHPSIDYTYYDQSYHTL